MHSIGRCITTGGALHQEKTLLDEVHSNKKCITTGGEVTTSLPVSLPCHGAHCADMCPGSDGPAPCPPDGSAAELLGG